MRYKTNTKTKETLINDLSSTQSEINDMRAAEIEEQYPKRYNYICAKQNLIREALSDRYGTTGHELREMDIY